LLLRQKVKRRKDRDVINPEPGHLPCHADGAARTRLPDSAENGNSAGHFGNRDLDRAQLFFIGQESKAAHRSVCENGVDTCAQQIAVNPPQILFVDAIVILQGSGDRRHYTEKFHSVHFKELSTVSTSGLLLTYCRQTAILVVPAFHATDCT